MNEISTIIDWIMRGAISIIGVAVGYFIAKDKYIFQKTYDRKLTLITDLYQQIVRLEFELKNMCILSELKQAKNQLIRKESH